MKKILFYCQYLAGMGHLVRSTEMIRSLVPAFRVCLVTGGEPIPGFTIPAEVEVVYLLALREEAGKLNAISPHQTLEAVQSSRRQQLLAAFEQFQPDCVITECFPFSKYKMAFELLPLLERARAAQVKVVCSLRDLIMTQAMSEAGRERKRARIHDQIRQYYDLILFHSDRTLQSLEACFPTAPDLDCEVFYTGYVAQSPSGQSSLTAEDRVALNAEVPIIVASVGGGRDGYPLLQAIVEASSRLQQILPHQIYAFVGPLMPAAQFEPLQALAAQQPNVTLRRFTPHLIRYLEQADLSVSLGGYNTTMNVLRTGVRALILPSPSVDQADEQQLRATLLAQRGVVDLLSPEQLAPDRLTQAILESLSKPSPSHNLNLNGAQNACQRLQALLASAQSEAPLESQPVPTATLSLISCHSYPEANR